MGIRECSGNLKHAIILSALDSYTLCQNMMRQAGSDCLTPTLIELVAKPAAVDLAVSVSCGVLFVGCFYFTIRVLLLGRGPWFLETPISWRDRLASPWGAFHAC